MPRTLVCQAKQGELELRSETAELAARLMKSSKRSMSSEIANGGNNLFDRLAAKSESMKTAKT